MHVPAGSAGAPVPCRRDKTVGHWFPGHYGANTSPLRLRFKLRRNRKGDGCDGGSSGARRRRARVRVGGGGTVMTDGTCPCDSTANTDGHLESGRWEPLEARYVPSNLQRENLQDKLRAYFPQIKPMLTLNNGSAPVKRSA